MLEALVYFSREDVDQYFNKIDLTKSTWVVSDLRAKIQLQNRLLSEVGFFEEQWLLRASELWKKLALINRPDLGVLTPAGAKLLARSWLEALASQWDVFQGVTPEHWLAVFESWQSAVLSQSVSDIFDQALKTKDFDFEVQGNTQREFLLSRVLANHFLQEKKVLPSWIPFLLVEHWRTPLARAWDRDLVIDFRGEIRPIEAELFVLLSRELDQNVRVFVPQSSFESDYPWIEKSYAHILQHCNQKTLLGLGARTFKPEVQSLRSSNPLGEVRWLVDSIQEQKSKDDTPWSEFLVLCPDVEAYKPALMAHFSEVGLPLKVDDRARGLGYQELQLWLSHLKALLKAESYEDTERIHFSPYEEVDVLFEEFKSKLSELYVPGMKGPLSQTESSVESKKGTLREFLDWSLRSWPKTLGPPSSQVLEVVEEMLKKVFQEDFLSKIFSYKESFLYLEEVLHSIEAVTQEEPMDGVLLGSWKSSFSTPFRAIFILGLSDENLKKRKRTGVSVEEQRFFFKNFGVYIEAAEEKDPEYEIRWILEAYHQPCRTYLSAPQTDWSGQLQTLPHLILSSDYPTVEIGLQVSFWSGRVGASRENDRLEDDQKKITFFPKKISPSSIELYQSCGFSFLSSRGFGLQDLDDEDFDVSYRKKGTQAHELAALIVARFEEKGLLSLEEIESLVNDWVSGHREPDVTSFMRQAKLKHWREWANAFWSWEVSWREAWPGLRNASHEIPWKKTIDFKNQSLLITGRMDRLDVVEQSAGSFLLVLDYKSSTQGRLGFKNWIKSRDFQLLFYAWALNQGEMEIPSSLQQSRILGLTYLDLRRFLPEPGVWFSDHMEFVTKLFQPKKTQQTTSKDFQDMMSELERVLFSSLEKMHEGEYFPKPADEGDCKYCRWNQICRAPHLN